MPAYTAKELAAVVSALREKGFSISEHEASSVPRLVTAIQMTPPRPLKKLLPLNRRAINMSMEEEKPCCTPQAIHEASHVVVGHRLGMRVKRASIGNNRGMAVFHNGSPLELSRDASTRRAELDDRLHSDAIVALAGGEGEFAILGVNALGIEDDIARVVLVADRLKIPERDQPEMIDVWTETARSMVAENRDTIIAVAEALDRRTALGGGEIRAIIRNGTDEE